MTKNKELVRIIGEIKYISGSNQSQIAEEIGINKNYLSNMVNGRSPFTDDVKEKIRKLYPEVFRDEPSNDDYSGSGIVDRIIKVIDDKCNGSQNDYSKKLGMSQTTVNSQIRQYKRISMDVAIQTLNVFSDLSAEWLMRGTGDMYRSDSQPCIPLIPTLAIGGALTGFASDGSVLADCERVISPFRQADYAMEVYGESMAPEYPSGSRIFIKRVKEGSFIKWGEVYVLDTCNGAVVKEVQPCEDGESVRCISLNPNGKFKPFEVRKEDIYGIYQVLGCLIVK